MAMIRRKLTRLEDAVNDMMPTKCRCCERRNLITFPDEPDVTGAMRYPYDTPGGVCRLCRQPPPAIHGLPLSSAQREAFAAIPWSAMPKVRYLEKMTLILAIWHTSTRDRSLAIFDNLVERFRIESVEKQLEELFQRNFKPVKG